VFVSCKIMETNSVKCLTFWSQNAFWIWIGAEQFYSKFFRHIFCFRDFIILRFFLLLYAINHLLHQVMCLFLWKFWVTQVRSESDFPVVLSYSNCSVVHNPFKKIQFGRSLKNLLKINLYGQSAKYLSHKVSPFDLSNVNGGVEALSSILQKIHSRNLVQNLVLSWFI